MSATTIPRPTRAAPALRFARHFGEMVLAMCVGMWVFGAVLTGILLAAGTSFTEALEAAPELIALVLAVNMTVPMVWWMRHRGHARGRVNEMAGAMLATAPAAILMMWFSVIDGTAICGVECGLMVVGMIGVMLLHPREYSGARGQ